MLHFGAWSMPKQQRLNEHVKCLPVIFVISVIVGLYFVYMRLHCIPRLSRSPEDLGSWAEAACFNAITCMLVVCYAYCLLVHPGTIPDKEEDPTWEYVAQDRRHAGGADSGENSDAALAMSTTEFKRCGERRQCKWCAKYKPDRCHHCRVCRMCILKMDHHCPWIYNCVGYKNYKYFFLLLFYAWIDCLFIVVTMRPSVRAALQGDAAFLPMFLLLFGETLAGFLGVLVTAFFGFHVHLMLRSMTTIEFCEKSVRRSNYDTASFDRGPWGNITAVLGNNPLLWLLPCNLPSGRGVSFVSEDMRLLY